MNYIFILLLLLSTSEIWTVKLWNVIVTQVEKSKMKP